MIIAKSDVSNRRQARRRVPRTTVNVECRRGGMGLGKNLVTQFLDISEGGVRIVVKESFAPRDEVEVLILGCHLGKSIKRLANICWSLPLENGNFCVGVEFQKRLAFGEVSQIARP